MSWIALTLVSAAILGMIGVLDKAFLYHYARSLRTLPLLIAIGPRANWNRVHRDLTVGGVDRSRGELEPGCRRSWRAERGGVFQSHGETGSDAYDPGRSDVSDLRRTPGRPFLGREFEGIPLARHAW